MYIQIKYLTHNLTNSLKDSTIPTRMEYTHYTGAEITWNFFFALE